jgi:ribonuclease HII
MIKYIIGIDEAGRGPLAGPVSVGVVLVPAKFKWKLLPGVGDSKALSEKKREEVYELTEGLKAKAGIVPVVVFKSAKEIDKRGIAVVIREAIKEGLEAVMQRTGAKVEECQVLLDGSLKAPAEYCQETIIKGDAKEPAIGLASIYAKVERDRYMVAIAKKKAYLPYNLALHKGYGTKMHREAIAKYGLSKEHRASFCKNINLLAN